MIGFDWEPPGAYTRARAIEDGVLVDVTETAREVGFRCPVAVTSAVCWDVKDYDRASGPEVAARLWDLLWMGNLAAPQVAECGCVYYRLRMPVRGCDEDYRAKLVYGPGDDGEPVVEIMLPWECS